MAISSGLYKEVDISSTQILNDLSSGIILLPINTGVTTSYYDIEKVIIEYNHVTTPYTISAATWIVLQLNNSQRVYLSTNQLSSGLNSYMIVNHLNYAIYDTVNQINLSGPSRLLTNLNMATFGGVIPTGGDGTMKVKIWYSILKYG